MKLDVVHPVMDAYLKDVLPPRDPVAAEMEAYAARHGFPIVGPLVGHLLFVLARACGARRVYEMGSGYGYSTLWFARAVGPGGQVVHTDGDAENSRRAREYLGRAGLADRVRFEVGDARQLIAREPGPFDVVFCDVDKEQYPDVPGLAVPRLRAGGLLVIDNLLWDGWVAEPADADDDETRGIQELTRRLYADPGLATTIVPLRDGVSVSVKL